MGLLNRNFITNLGGLALTLYGGNEIANGKMTVEKMLATVPAAIVSFATGVNDKKLNALSKLNHADRAVAKDVFGQILDRVMSRYGYSVSSVNTPESSHEFIPDVPVDAYRGSGRIESTSEPTPEQRASQYFSEQIASGRRLPNIPQSPIEGTDITPMRFAMESMGGDDDDNSYSLPVQGGGEWQN
jgi:hypothetical protein